MANTDGVGHARGFTVLLCVAGFFFLLLAVAMHSIAEQIVREEGGDVWAFEMVRNLEIIIAVACFVVATLRSLESPVAGTATAGLSIALALFFPFGTALFLWYVFKVRKIESFGGGRPQQG
ncbi:MAG: hypothetical protein AAGD14_02030 [Planctomycetota bacterium]